MNTLKLNFKLIFTLISISIFSISGLFSQSQSINGDLDVSGSITTGSAYFIGDGNLIYKGSDSGAITYQGDHTNIAQLVFDNSRGIELGRIFGNPKNFGLRDAEDRWSYQAHENFTGFRVQGIERMRIFSDGKIRIGTVNTSPADYKLFVEDGILTEKVRVALNNTNDWADYVFEDDYELMPIEEVDGFIKKNNHLPNVPSAEEMVEKGLDVLESDAILLRKIEEAYLYIIQQNERIAKLEAQVNNAQDK